MTDPLSIAIAAAATAVAIVAGWVQWPRNPELDGERWFKVLLATLLRGEVEARGGTAEEWEAQVVRFVPYHPAGRLPERKVVNPVAARLPGAMLPGERALLEQLARRHTVQERWRWLYDEDPAALDARLDDPIELGPACDPAERFGNGASWEALAAWGGGDPGFGEQVLRRFPARWVLVEGRADRLAGPSLLDALQQVLGSHAVRIPWVDAPDAVERLSGALRAQLSSRDARLMLVAEEAGVAVLLRALHGGLDIRDQVHAVLSIGGVIGGRPGEEGPFGERDARDWLGACFTQAGMDTEVVRLTPYLSVAWLDREAPVVGSAGLPLEAQRFPVPREDGSVETVEAVDLGVLPPDPQLPRLQVARALVTVSIGWVLSRR